MAMDKIMNITDEAREMMEVLSGEGVDFYQVINKSTSCIVDITIDADKADQRCRELNKETDSKDFIYEFVNN